MRAERYARISRSPARPKAKTQKKRPRSPSKEKIHKKAVIEKPTTLMLKNLPNELTRGQLLDIMIDEGFGDLVNFVYVPVNFSEASNFGYGFVNLETYEDAQRCREKIQGFSQWPVDWDKGMEVNDGDTFQGIDELIARYRNSSVMHYSVPDGYRPAIYERGRRLPFPTPTKDIRKKYRLRKWRNATVKQRQEEAAAAVQASKESVES